jgi:hypothetical protein
MKKPIKRKKPAYKFNSVLLIDDSELDVFINQKVLESNYFAENIYVNTGGVNAMEFLKNLMMHKTLTPSLTGCPYILY